MLSFFSSLMETITQYAARDMVEILLLSTGIYLFMRWLNQDTQKNSVFYFYGYCGLLFGAQVLHLTIISQLLILLAPVVLCIFIIMHQHTLQKNFVALKPVQLMGKSDEHWIDELMRTSLYAMNRSKNLLWVIERTDSLEASLEAPFLFYADLKKDLVDLLLETHQSADVQLWMQQTGKLVAFHTSWKTENPAEWLSPQAHQLPAWQQHALLISAKTDALFIYSCAITRLCTIIMHERCIENLTAHQASILLKRIIINKTMLHEGVSYAAQSAKSTAEQHRS